MKECPACSSTFDSGDACPHDGTALVACMDPLVGNMLKGLYKIERRVGRGGMGAVYEATQVNLGRSVAVKVLNPLMVAEDDALKRFQREIKLLSQISHPNIVSILDSGRTDSGLRYMVMEYLRGQTLRQAVPREQGLPMDRVAEIFTQICSAVGAAHQLKLVHRDLKPENVILAEVAGGRTVAKVLDFGIARGIDEEATRLTADNASFGTPGYLAPEQIQDASSADERSDIYALGAVLYFLVGGKPPFGGRTSQSVIRRQLDETPAPLDFEKLGKPKALGDVIARALQKDPTRRHQTVAELLADFHEACALQPSRADTPPLAPPPQPRAASRAPGRPPRLAALAAGLLLAGLGAGLAWWFLPRGTDRDPARAPGPPRAPWTFRGVTDERILLGISAAFSGPSKELGREMQVGIETCFRHVNDSGGVHGRKLELIALDDGYEPDRARENVRKLLQEERVFAMIGNVGTPTAEVTVPYAVQNSFLLFGAFTGAGLLRRDPPERYVFNYRASYLQETAAMVGYFLDVRKLPPESIAVLAQNDSYGDAGFEGVARTLRHRAGVDARSIPRFGYDRNTGRVEEAVRQTLERGDGIRAVIIVATYRPAAKYIFEVRKAGLSPLFANVSFVGSRALAEEFQGTYGGESGEGVVVTQVVPHYELGATAVLRFRQRLARHFPSEPPGFIALEGYIAASLLVEGLRRAGWELDTERLVDTLELMEPLDLGIGTVLRFGPSRHQASDKVWGAVLDRHGRYAELDLD